MKRVAYTIFLVAGPSSMRPHRARGRTRPRRPMIAPRRRRAEMPPERGGAANAAVNRIVIKPAWVLASDTGDHFEPQLFRLLRAIHDSGKLTVAARAVGLSYRHAWDLLGRWNAIFGSEARPARARPRRAPVGARRKAPLGGAADRGGALSAARERRQRTQRRHSPRPRARDSGAAHHASHGYAIEKVPDLVRDHGSVEVDLKYMSSVDAVASLARGDCDLAGFHVPEGDLGAVLWAQYAPFSSRASRRSCAWCGACRA